MRSEGTASWIHPLAPGGLKGFRTASCTERLHTAADQTVRLGARPKLLLLLLLLL